MIASAATLIFLLLRAACVHFLLCSLLAVLHRFENLLGIVGTHAALRLLLLLLFLILLLILFRLLLRLLLVLLLFLLVLFFLLLLVVFLVLILVLILETQLSETQVLTALLIVGIGTERALVEINSLVVLLAVESLVAEVVVVSSLEVGAVGHFGFFGI